MAFDRRGGQPDLRAQNHGCGPTAVGYLGFPSDVISLAPVQRESNEFGVPRRRGAAIAPRPAEFRPIRPCCGCAQGEQRQRQEGEQSALVAVGERFAGGGERAFVAIHARNVNSQTSQGKDFPGWSSLCTWRRSLRCQGRFSSQAWNACQEVGRGGTRPYLK